MSPANRGEPQRTALIMQSQSTAWRHRAHFQSHVLHSTGAISLALCLALLLSSLELYGGSASLGGIPSPTTTQPGTLAKFSTSAPNARTSSIISNQSTGGTTSVTVGGSPSGIAFDGANRFIYVTNTGIAGARADNVTIINASTERIVGTIAVGLGPTQIAVDPSNDHLFVSDTGGSGAFSSNEVSIIDAASNTLVDTVTVGTQPEGLAYDSSNGDIYVANVQGGNVSVINGSSNKIIGTIPVGPYPTYVDFDPANGLVYVSHSISTNLTIIDGSTNSVVSTLTVGNGGGGIAVNNRTGAVYIADYDAHNVTVLDGSNNAVIGTIGVGFGPSGIAYDAPDNSLWVSNQFSNNLSEINGTTNRVVTSIQVGTDPVNLAIDTANGDVYVANWGSGNISVIPPGAVTYLVSFSESGLAQGTSWSMTLNGILDTSAGESILFQEPNGLFGFLVGNVPGYSSSPTNGSVTVDGSPQYLMIVFTNSTAPLRILTFSLLPSRLSLGSTSNVSVVVSGGVGLLHYFYTGFPTACAPPDRASWTCTPTRSGTWTVSVRVNDSVGHTTEASTNLVVIGAGTPSKLTPDGSYAVGVGLIALLIAGVIAVMSRRRRDWRGGEVVVEDPYHLPEGIIILRQSDEQDRQAPQSAYGQDVINESRPARGKNADSMSDLF